MAKKRVKIDRSKCMACKSCEIACMVAHDEDKNVYSIDLEGSGAEPRLCISRPGGFLSETPNTPIICRHCDDPACVNACMSGALQKNAENGLVLYNENACAHCYMCIMSCPFGNLRADRKTKTKILKCDFCVNQPSPACAKACPSGCLSIIERG